MLIDMLIGELVGIGIDMLVGVRIIAVVVSVTIALEFGVSASYAGSVLVGMRLEALATVYSDDITYATESGIGVDMLADLDVNLLTAVMTALKFITPVSLTDSVPFC